MWLHKMVTPHARREAIRQMIAAHELSERRACGLAGLSRTGFRQGDSPDSRFGGPAHYPAAQISGAARLTEHTSVFVKA